MRVYEARNWAYLQEDIERQSGESCILFVGRLFTGAPLARNDCIFLVVIAVGGDLSSLSGVCYHSRWLEDGGKRQWAVVPRERGGFGPGHRRHRLSGGGPNVQAAWRNGIASDYDLQVSVSGDFRFDPCGGHKYEQSTTLFESLSLCNVTIIHIETTRHLFAPAIAI